MSRKAKISLVLISLVLLTAGAALAQLTTVGVGYEQVATSGSGYVLQLNLDKILLLQGGALQKD